MGGEARTGPRYARSLTAADVGARVVVRRVVPGGLGDLLGVLTAWTEDTLTVETDATAVTVPLADLVAGKRVPDRPVRARPPADPDEPR